jgi:hypothetical protein
MALICRWTRYCARNLDQLGIIRRDNNASICRLALSRAQKRVSGDETALAFFARVSPSGRPSRTEKREQRMRVEKDLTGSSTLAFFGRVFDRAIVRLIAPHSLQCNLRTITRPSADQPIARTKTQPKHASGDGPLPGGFLKLLLSLLPSDTHVVHVTFIIAANLSATHCVARSFFSNPSELK